MKILLFGGSGQLGFELTKRAFDLHFELLAPVTKEVDITDPVQVQDFVQRLKPEVIINSAAYTAVDKAEQEPERAYALNRDGARNVAEAAANHNARVLHVSTDYVFDGSRKAPLDEEAATNPINIYGASKLAGEEAVLNVLGRQGLVVRTSSLHGRKGLNFVHTMLDLFANKDRVQVVQDQFMSPTWAGWLAEVLLDLVRIECHGVLHACGAGVTSWFKFAQNIHERVAPHMERCAILEPTSSDKFPRPARRPVYSGMNCDKLTRLLGRPPLPWQEGLRFHLAELGYD